MRIAYACYWNLLEKDGIAKKITAQVAHWRAAGDDVEVFCLSRGATTRSDWRLFPFQGVRRRFLSTQALQRAVLEWAPDLVYLRYDLFLPPLGKILRSLPTVVEIQTNDRAEARLRPRRSVRLYNEVNRHLLLSRARGIVAVTHEVAGLPYVARHGKPTAVIGNAVDLARLRELPPPANERPEAAFLGSTSSIWHGIDKLLWLARQLAHVRFHVVGYGEEHLPSQPPPNVVAHGVLSREEYEPILERCDIGIGTLALHRKAMRETSSLKVREYLGYGLPIVIADEDIDLVGRDAWWLLRLPNEESNVYDRVEEIGAFIERVRGRRVPRAEVAQLIGAHVKERARLDFLQRVVVGEAAPKLAAA